MIEDYQVIIIAVNDEKRVDKKIFIYGYFVLLC